MIPRQQISDEVWNDNYKAKGESSLEDTWERQAKACAEVEDPSIREKIYNDFLWLLKDFKGIAGGRITANLGVEGREATSLMNCFVHAPGDIGYHDVDSIAGIYDMLKAQALTLKSEGGYGMNFSWIRPAGSYVNGIAGRTPGVLKFMELWDKSSEVITMGSEKVLNKKEGEKKKIRKGAQMAVLMCHHPEIEDFIIAKQTENRLTKFNMSVGITPGFMEAVEADDYWDLIFPNTDYEKYNDEWSGNIEDWQSKGYPITVYQTLKARDLWEKIMKSTYNRNEPGVLFLDVANKLNPLNYAENIMTTNPCFHGDERFLTVNGYVKFKDSAEGINYEAVQTDNRISFNKEAIDEHPINWEIDPSQSGTTIRSTSSAFITQKKASLIKVKFSNGQTIVCTPDHHIATTSGMIEAKDLNPDHEVLVSAPTPPDHSIVNTFPEKNIEQLYFLIGLVHGCSVIDCNFVHIDLPDINDHIVKITQDYLDLLDIKYTITYNKDGRVRISSSQFLDYLKDSYNILNDIVPEQILNRARSKECLFYLSGLYQLRGVVSYNSKNIQISLSHTNEVLLQKVQLLLHANGILSKLYKKQTDQDICLNGQNYTQLDCYELITISDSWQTFAQLIDFKTSKDSYLYGLTHVCDPQKTYEYVSVISIENQLPDTVYCIKEDVTRSIIVNTISTRRCGEISMSCGVCLLFSLNLPKYIKENNGKYEFDFDTFRKASEISVRFADNINDISRVPLDDYKISMLEKRRVGIGVLGLGSLLAILGIRYGSPESVELVEKIFTIKAETELLTSAKLGQEKGSFKLFDKEKYFSTYWWKTLPISHDVKSQIEHIGCMRNSHRSANAPTGNMSVYAGVVSGGIEPIFMLEYSRWSIVTEGDRAALRQDGFKFPDVFKGEWFETEHLKKSKAGTEEILVGEYKGIQYQCDKNRGLTKKSMVEDWGWSFIKENLSQEEIDRRLESGVLATADILSHKEHIDILKVIAKYTDMNSSKTINLPNDYSYEDFKSIYMDAWKSGIKGVTTYRSGTMTAVLEANDVSAEDIKRSAPKRPKELECNIHTAKVNGHKWVVIIGMLDNSPYEIFAGPAENIDVKNGQVGTIIKRKKGEYCLQVDGELLFVNNDGENIYNIVDILDDPSSAWATRLVSMSLRHGVPMEYIYEQLNKDGFITDVNKVLARILKKYTLLEKNTESTCPRCSSKNVRLDGSCIVCMDCSYGKCG